MKFVHPVQESFLHGSNGFLCPLKRVIESSSRQLKRIVIKFIVSFRGLTRNLNADVHCLKTVVKIPDQVRNDMNPLLHQT